MIQKCLAVVLALTAAAPAFAAPSAVVEGLALPAWIVRDGRRLPIAPGQAVAVGEAVVTGRGSRALLRLDDGSAVKLGENTRFVVSSAASTDGASPLFRATLRVLAGAFRFTTSALVKQRMQRDVTIQLPTVTAGIRGTDLWGKATEDREFVVLIEGKIGVRRGQEAEVGMDRPMTVFDAPKGAPTPPLVTIPAGDLAKAAAETEIAPGSGGLRTDGAWKVIVVSTRAQDAALAAYDRLRDAGYPAMIDPRGRGAATVYRVRLGGLPSREDAEVLAKRIGAEFDLKGATVSR